MEVRKQVLRGAIATTKKIIYYTIVQTWYQAIKKIFELKNEVTKPTDILEDKRDMQVV